MIKLRMATGVGLLLFMATMACGPEDEPGPGKRRRCYAGKPGR